MRRSTLAVTIQINVAHGLRSSLNRRKTRERGVVASAVDAKEIVADDERVIDLDQRRAGQPDKLLLRFFSWRDFTAGLFFQ